MSIPGDPPPGNIVFLADAATGREATVTVEQEATASSTATDIEMLISVSDFSYMCKMSQGKIPMYQCSWIYMFFLFMKERYA